MYYYDYDYYYCYIVVVVVAVAVIVIVVNIIFFSSLGVILRPLEVVKSKCILFIQGEKYCRGFHKSIPHL